MANNVTPDLKAKLENLKASAQTNQDQINQISKINALVLQDIASLNAGINDVAQIVKAYTQSSTLKTDQDSLHSFVGEQKNEALKAIGAGKQTLDDIVTRVNKSITDQENTAAENQKTSEKAVADQTAALQKANVKQAAYDTAKTTLPRAQAAVTELKSLKAQVTSAANNRNFGAMYILLQEMETILASLAIPAPADLQTQLNSALADLQSALSDSRVQQQKTADAAADLADAQKKLNELKLGRRASLLDAVANWKAPAPPPAPAPVVPAPAPAD
jgi:hypothetical protein